MHVRSRKWPPAGGISLAADKPPPEAPPKAQFNELQGLTLSQAGLLLGYRVGMAAPMPDSTPVPPDPTPESIRASLSPSLRAEFDREWEIVLDEAKRDKTLDPVYDILSKWRHTAYMELRDPGSYYRLLAQCEQILRTRKAPEGSISGDEMKALLSKRLGRQV